MTHHEHGNGVPRDDLRIALENGSSESAIRPPVATAPGLSNVALPSALPSFYKRPLPASCIAFDSAEGKGLFRAGLLEGYMAKYFSLAQSFLTQNEPAFCGLATLCMILNALGVDPQQQWKGPWRYYSQEMLDCCRPLADVERSGITLSEFACLARCNGLDEHTRHGNSVSITDFENDIERVCGSEDGAVMAVSYSRKALGQTGDGHFSPIGGYCKSARKVLILDVARFKYPSYWVAVDELYASLKPIDRVTGQPRGYSIVQVAGTFDRGEGGLLSLNFNKQSWPAFLRKLPALSPSTLSELFEQIIHLLQSIGITPLHYRGPTPEQLQQAHNEQQLDPVPAKLLSATYNRQISQLADILQNSSIWQPVIVAIGQSQPVSTDHQSTLEPLLYSLFLSALLTSPSISAHLKGLWEGALVMDEPILKKSPLLQKEISFLQQQMASLERCCSSESACACLATNFDIRRPSKP